MSTQALKLTDDPYEGGIEPHSLGMRPLGWRELRTNFGNGRWYWKDYRRNYGFKWREWFNDTIRPLLARWEVFIHVYEEWQNEELYESGIRDEETFTTTFIRRRAADRWINDTMKCWDLAGAADYPPPCDAKGRVLVDKYVAQAAIDRLCNLLKGARVRVNTPGEPAHGDLGVIADFWPDGALSIDFGEGQGRVGYAPDLLTLARPSGEAIDV